MELITGGFGQGKLSFVEKNFPGCEIWKDFEQSVKSEMKKGLSQMEIESLVFEKIENSPDIKIIATELGCGIVPVESFDRQWRETTGRILCKLAEKAESVYRVTCGIGVKIK